MNLNIATFIHPDTEIQSGVMLYSLILNSKSNLNIVCFHKDIIDKNKFAFCPKFNVNLEFIHIQDNEDECILKLSSLLTFDKVLYLRYNCIILKDLSELYNQNTPTISFVKFNTDVLLLNLLYLKETDFIKESLIHLEKYNIKKIIELVLKDKINYIDFKYNLPNDRKIIDNDRIYESKSDYMIKTFKDLNNPYIISYVNIPWTIRYVLYQDIWKQYYKQYCILTIM